LRPGLKEALFTRAMARRRSGDLAGSAADFSLAIEQHPNYWMARSNLAGVLMKQEKFAAAIVELGRVLAQVPSAPAYRRRSIAYQLAGKPKQAMSDAEQAVKLSPSPDSLFQRAECHLQAHDLRGAIADYNRVIKQDPTYHGARGHRGLAYLALGELQLALADYKASVATYPQEVSSWLGLGKAQLKLRQGDAAIAAFEQALVLGPSLADAHRLLGMARRARGDLAGALRSLNRAIQLNPRFAPAYFQRGLLHASQQQHEKALSDARRLTRLDSGRWGYWWWYGNLLRKAGHAKASSAALRKAHQLAPEKARAQMKAKLEQTRARR